MKCAYFLTGLIALLLQACANVPSETIAMKKSENVAYMGDCRRVPQSKSSFRHSELRTSNARCYSKTDLDRTGGIDISDALRKLDPSIQ